MTTVTVGPPITLGPNYPQYQPRQRYQQQQQQQQPFGNLCGPCFGPWEFGAFGDCGAANCCAVINGIALIIFGIISISLGIGVATYYTDFNGYAYAPIWAGILCLLGGVVGVSTCCCFGNREGLQCMLFVFFSVCIVVVIGGLVQIVSEGARSSELDLYDESADGDPNRYDAIKALHTSAAIFGALAVLAAFIGGLLACFCSCCDDGLGRNVVNYPQRQQPGYVINEPPPAYNQGGMLLRGGGLPILGGNNLLGGNVLGGNLLGGNVFGGGQDIII